MPPSYSAAAAEGFGKAASMGATRGGPMVVLPFAQRI
jgi:hypothetical protein